MVLPAVIVWCVAISIIVIALSILIRLIVYLIAGKVLLNKVSQLTESIDLLVHTIQEKSNDIGNQATETLRIINRKIEPSCSDKKESNRWVGIFNKVIVIGSAVAQFVFMIKKARGGSNGKK